MNLPNKLTMLRMILIPVMIVFYLLRNAFGLNVYWIMGIIFVVASFTDFLDGHIARKRNIVTTFGKFMDPLADKLLVMTALLIIADVYAKNLLGNMWMPFWVPLIILAREFIVTSVRLVAVNEGKVIAASNLGKAKTALTMLSIIWYLFALPINFSDSLSLIVSIIGWTLMGGSVLMTLISGYDYVWKNRNIIFTSI